MLQGIDIPPCISIFSSHNKIMKWKRNTHLLTIWTYLRRIDRPSLKKYQTMGFIVLHFRVPSVDHFVRRSYYQYDILPLLLLIFNRKPGNVLFRKVDLLARHSVTNVSVTYHYWQVGRKWTFGCYCLMRDTRARHTWAPYLGRLLIVGSWITTQDMLIGLTVRCGRTHSRSYCRGNPNKIK